MIEGMICGTIPVTCSDNLAAKEFSPSEFICEPNAQAIVNKIEELNKKYSSKRKLALEYGKKYKNQFNKKSIATNIIDIFNSRPTPRWLSGEFAKSVVRFKKYEKTTSIRFYEFDGLLAQLVERMTLNH